MKSWDFQGKNKKELMENINQWLNRYYKNMYCKVNDNWDFRLIDNQTNTDDEFNVNYDDKLYWVDKDFIRTMANFLRYGK